jgi:hypothetical protein
VGFDWCVRITTIYLTNLFLKVARRRERLRFAAAEDYVSM